MGVVVAALAAAAWLARAPAEVAIRARLVREAARNGLTLHLTRVRVGVAPLVALEGLRLQKPGTWALETEEIALTAARRVTVAHARLTGPADLALDVVPTEWVVVGRNGVDLQRPVRGLSARWSNGGGVRRVDVRAEDVPLGRLVTLRRAGEPLVDPGVVGGTVTLARASEATSFDVDLRGRAVRLAALDDGADDADYRDGFGAPSDVQSRLVGSWEGQRFDLRSWRLGSGAAAASGSLSVDDIGHDARVDLALHVDRLDFAGLLALSALDAPAIAAGTPAAPGSLGSAALQATVSGRLSDPSSFRVAQRLAFDPPPRPLPALERLRGPFEHEATAPDGVVRIDVSPDSPDFIALDDVPPLFVETVLLGEDYGFFGHRGLDLTEMPAALLRNWERGGAVRGASTITQQLAKNLFLRREKRVGRKLQELSLALLLEATLDKRRILEVYLNVIEWGPGLYGLRPACRHYFGLHPRELSPKQMAFLVAVIPGPRKYQRSFAGGTLSPGFRPLVDSLLGKLRSVGALGEDEYRAALAEEIVVRSAADAAGVSTR